MENTLYYGDNLDILKRYIPDESVDPVYLDPPLKSNQNYNVLFKEQNGSRSASQIRAFEGAGRVLICEGEIDALTAILAGQVGVGLPGWSHFKDAWIGDFRGKDVILVLDADEAGQKGTRDIARRFIRAASADPGQREGPE
jgi:site-specific DNA-methyltransferase (adenine-specific)